MNVLHLLTGGNTGGIEILMKNYALGSLHNNYFFFVFEGGIIAEEMQNVGAYVDVLKIKSFGALATFRKVAAFCKSEGIDTLVVHHEAPIMKLIMLYIKIIMPSIVAIAYTHENAFDICDSSRKKGLWLRKKVQKIAYRKCDAVIAISQSVKESLEEYLSVDSKKITVIYNGVPIPSKRHFEEKKIDQCVHMVYVGRLAEVKGVQTTLEALAKIRDQVEFAFDIIGEGPYREELERMTTEFGLTDKVRFWGLRRDVNELLESKDIFIHMPVWEEGFGITIIEAMAAGCVCVCAKKGGIPEIVSDGENGFLVHSATADELASVLLRVCALRETDKWQEMQCNAYNRANTFSIEEYCRKLDQYISETKVC